MALSLVLGFMVSGLPVPRGRFFSPFGTKGFFPPFGTLQRPSSSGGPFFFFPLSSFPPRILFMLSTIQWSSLSELIPLFSPSFTFFFLLHHRRLTWLATATSILLGTSIFLIFIESPSPPFHILQQLSPCPYACVILRRRASAAVVEILPPSPPFFLRPGTPRGRPPLFEVKKRGIFRTPF